MKLLTYSLFVLLTSAIYCQTDTITILHVNDTHSTLAPLGPRDQNLKGTVGGIARAASVIGLNKMTESNVLAFHGGDLFVGDIFFNLFFGVPELMIMQQLGFDAMGVGNHEFDLYPSTLLTALDSSFIQFPLVSSNLILDGMPGLNNYIKTDHVKMIGNTKVGIFGLTTPDANVFSLPAPVVIDTGYVMKAAAEVNYLKSQGCKLIICLSHLGYYYDMGLASVIPGIDVIISSHDHLRTDVPIEITDPQTNKVTYIVQTEGFYKSVGKLQLKVNNTNGQIQKISYGIIDLDANVPEEPSVAGVVEGLITQLEAVSGIPFFTQQLGTATAFFEETADSLMETGKTFDTPVGNLVTDAYRWKTGTQIAIQVGGSTAQPLYAGKFVRADIFRMIGYGFNERDGLGYRLVTFKLKGTDLVAGLEIGLQGIELNDELLPQVSGLIYKYDPASPAFSRIREVYIAGAPLDTGAVYTVTANEFLVAALGGFGVNIQEPVVDTNAVEFLVVTDYITHLGGTITPVLRGYIYTEIEQETGMAPEGYILKQNFPNPFNPSTLIRYHVSSAAGNIENQSVLLKVYDVLGNEVATLVNEEKTAGDYEVKFDGKNLVSGIYFYELSVRGFRKVMKMNLVK